VEIVLVKIYRSVTNRTKYNVHIEIMLYRVHIVMYGV